MKKGSDELLRTKATFMCLHDVLATAKSNRLDGRVRVGWDKNESRLIEWVGEKKLPPEILEQSAGFITLYHGAIVGAGIGADTATADLDVSLDTLMQMCYGIGCGVLPSTVLVLEEAEIAPADIIGKLSDMEITERLDNIDKSFSAFGE